MDQLRKITLNIYGYFSCLWENSHAIKTLISSQFYQGSLRIGMMKTSTHAPQTERKKTSYSWRSPTFSGQRSQLIWSGDTHLHSQWANGVSPRRDDECVVTKWCMLTDRRVEFPSPFSRLMDSLTSPCTYAKIIQGFRLLRFLQSLTGMMNVSKWNNQHGAQSLSWGPNKWLSLRKKEGKWRWSLARIHRNSARPWSWGGLTFYQY